MSEAVGFRKHVAIRAPHFLFAIGIIVLAVGIRRQFLQVSEPVHLAGGILLSCYLAWIFLETPITFRQAPTEPAETATLLAYALARLAVVVTATVLSTQWQGWADWMLIPMVAFIAGVALRLIAMRTLGRWYSHHVASGADQQAVTWGPYRVIRHPAYAGTLVAHIGVVAFFLNPLSVIFMMLLVVAIIWRIRVEERVLRDIPGYSAYSCGKPRLIPGVW